MSQLPALGIYTKFKNRAYAANILFFELVILKTALKNKPNANCSTIRLLSSTCQSSQSNAYTGV